MSGKPFPLNPAWPSYLLNTSVLRWKMIVLTAMAYDHYMVIYKILHYSCVMSWRLWHSNGGGLGRGLSTFLYKYSLHFPSALLWPQCHWPLDVWLVSITGVACTDTHIFGLLVDKNSGLICNLILLLVSYGVILLSLRTCSTEGQWKALSTCGVHISIVVSFFVPSIFA